MTKYAVITGASSGIGAEFARQLAKKNYHLILVARRKDRLEALAKNLNVPCSIICIDLSSEKECYDLMEQIKDKKIDIFINNAGFGDCNDFIHGTLKKEIAMIDVNIKAVHILTKLMLKQMEPYQSGAILNVASIAGLMPAGPYMATYYATKSYVTSLTRAIYQELKEKNSSIYIGCLCPGPVDTEFNKVANVEFSLHGISSLACVSYALKKMKKRKVIIIPTLSLRLAIILGRFLPTSWYVHIASHQQKKKIYRKKQK